jgi:hypothetical protein
LANFWKDFLFFLNSVYIDFASETNCLFELFSTCKINWYNDLFGEKLETNCSVCRHIQDYGFDSHVPCYINPTNISKDISICNLDCSDVMIVVDTIKSAFIPFVGQFWQSFLGSWSVLNSCLSDKIKMCKLDNLENWFKSRAFEIRSQLIKKIDDLKQISEKIANYVAEKFKLDSKNYNWIGYQWSIIERKNKENSFFECSVLIVDISNENNSSLDFKNDSIDFFNELMIEGIKVESVYGCDSYHANIHIKL